MAEPRRRPAAKTVASPFQEKVDYIESIAPAWQERMGLSHIEIEHHYIDVDSEMAIGSRPKNRPGVVRCTAGAHGTELSYTAFVETRWNYQVADVYFMLPSVVKWDNDRLEAIVVHEYCHILAAPEQYLLESKLSEEAANNEFNASDFDILATLYYERMEMATENMARAVLGAWKDR